MAGSPILWWLDTRSGAVESVLEDENARGTAARFSPDGQWLSYVSPEEEGTFVYNLFDGRSAFYPNEVGMPAAWHPTEEQLVIPNLDVVVIHGDEGEEHETHTHDFETAVHLFLADPATGEREQISPSMPVDDGSPAWSPDGEWLVVGRKKPRTATGRQLWLMRADGSEQRALTDDLLVNYGPPAWSPDGRFLLFQRFDLEDPNAEPAIWLFDLETESMQPIVAEGMQPAWLNP